MFTVAACSSAVHGPAAPADLGLLPPRCIGCRGLSGGGLDLCLCPRCRSEILAAPLAPLPLPGLDEVLAVTPYAGAALGVVASLKGGAVPAAAEVAAELIAEALG